MSKTKGLIVTFLALTIALAPALAEARAGSTTRSNGTTSNSSQGSRGSRTYDQNGAAPVQRSVTPQTAPSPSNPARPGMAPQPAGGSWFQQHPFLSGLAGGFVGSWIGSMLFPHGGGYGTGGSPFGSFMGGLFSWLLILGCLYMLYRLFFRRRMNPQTVPSMDAEPYYAPSQFTGNAAGGGMAQPSRGSNLTIAPDDYQAFEGLLKSIQDAWSRGDLAALRHYVTPELLSYFSEQLSENASQGVENHVEQIELLKGDLKEAWDEGHLQYASCYLRWKALDYSIRSGARPDEANALVAGDASRPVEAEELWTFARSPGGHWLLSAIQQV